MPCLVAEHDDVTRQPKPGGKTIPAVVEFAGRVFIQVQLNDGYGSRRAFYRKSGWAAGDGEFRWRLMPAEDAVAAGRGNGDGLRT